MSKVSQTYGSFILPDKVRLFPLPVLLLPGGRQRIRVIEVRYIDLITETLKFEKNFVLAFDINGLNKPYQWGVVVQIVNFDLSDNGFLLVDVEALAVVSLSGCEKSERGEWTAYASYVPHWTMINNRADTGKFSAVLRKLFHAYSGLSDLYRDPHFDSIEWVCARLIELLPVPDDAKKALLKTDDFQLVVSYLDTIIHENSHSGDLNRD